MRPKDFAPGIRVGEHVIKGQPISTIEHAQRRCRFVAIVERRDEIHAELDVAFVCAEHQSSAKTSVVQGHGKAVANLEWRATNSASASFRAARAFESSCQRSRPRSSSMSRRTRSMMCCSIAPYFHFTIEGIRRSLPGASTLADRGTWGSLKAIEVIARPGAFPSPCQPALAR